MQAEKGLPSALDRQPEVQPGLETFWRAFIDLDRSRSVGFGPNPIPPTHIVAWLDLQGINGPIRLEYAELISAMDAEYMAWSRKKRQRNGNTEPGNRREKS